jgi:hypothetical protein
MSVAGGDRSKLDVTPHGDGRATIGGAAVSELAERILTPTHPGPGYRDRASEVPTHVETRESSVRRHLNGRGAIDRASISKLSA